MRFALFATLYRKLAEGAPWKESAIAWAVSLIEGGREEESVLILAGLSGSTPMSEVEEYFDGALRELGEPPISEAEQALGTARAIADTIRSRTRDPVEAVARIHHVAVGPLNHPPLLQPWCDLDGGFRTLDGQMVERLDGDELNEAIVAFARTFLDAHPADQLTRLERELS